MTCRNLNPEECVMSIDAGTGSCRAVIFDKHGSQISISQREWSHPTAPEYPGSQIFETAKNWKLISECVRESLARARIEASKIKAVSTTSMREGMVLYDDRGREIWACPNVDSRSRAEAEYLIKNDVARKIYEISGDWVSITDAPRFLWIKKHEPETFRNIAHMGMISDWIVSRLCGEFTTEPSAGSSSGMFDLRKRDWSREIIEICGLSTDVFPRVFAAGTVAGEVSSEVSLETGLKRGTPVAVGGGDTQLGLIGIGVKKSNQVTMLGGSFWQHTILLDKSLVDPKIRLRTLCSTIPEQWMMEGIGFYCGLTMRWFRDAFCDKEKEDAKKLGTDAYVLMEEEAKTVPAGSNGLVGIFSNLMNSKQWVHASPSFIQFDISNPTTSGKKECIRAIEEAAGFVSLGHLKIIEEVSRVRAEEVTFGGGASKGTLWPQIIADILGIRVSVPVEKESTSLGAAICAGVGAGFYQKIQDGASEIEKVEKSLEPNLEAHEKYLDLYDRWLKLYAESLKISEEGLASPLWRAAGT